MNYSGNSRLRVYNRCKYDIGVKLLSGQDIVIRPASFQMLSVDDIFYIESICSVNKFFSKRMLVPVDNEGHDLTLDAIGMHEDETVVVHMNDEEIISMLKQTNKKIEAWIDSIEDEAQLHGIYEVAKTLDNLPASKLKLLSEKMPDKDWLN